jgi:hypothetical protein
MARLWHDVLPVKAVERVRRRLSRAPLPPSPPPRPKDPDFLFVVTYGRSGSTLLQGLLNALPRVLIRGENSLFVLPLYRACAQAMAFRHQHYMHRPRRVESAFYGLRNLRAIRFAKATRAIVADYVLGGQPRADYDVIGFKEVRWHEIEPEEMEGFFAFMDKAFPGARYVLNERRNREHVAASGFWRRREPDEVFAAIDRTMEVQEYLRRSRPERTHDCWYDEFISDDRAQSDAALRGLAAFVLGSCDDALLARLRDTMSVAFGPGSEDRPRRGPAAVDEGTAGA